jgi:hypothetical protein
VKTDVIYPNYIIYLSNRLEEGKLSKGSYRLMRMSSSAFEDYKYRFENDELFHQKQIELYRAEFRDKKIDDIFNDIS